VSAVRRQLIVLVSAAVAVTVAACGDSNETTAPPQQPARASEPGLEHIHGLGVRGGSLLIATHTGLWIAPKGQTRARRVGSSRQDIMGFSVISGDRFIGSGHPDPGQNLPPNLGLIESRDGGRNWSTVSLLGQADFHVLESAGRRVYGFDGTHGRLMISSDDGRTWAQRTPPAGIFGLAIEPGRPDEIVASTERGLFGSPNAGRRWRPMREDLGGLLAWPARDRLYMIDGSGRVQVSADRGRSWRGSGSIGGEPVAVIADGRDLYAALGDATVVRSSDGGRTWTVRATP
jgi:hypothetical protein